MGATNQFIQAGLLLVVIDAVPCHADPDPAGIIVAPGIPRPADLDAANCVWGDNVSGVLQPLHDGTHLLPKKVVLAAQGQLRVEDGVPGC